MAKIVNGSLVLDPDDYIDFVDNQGESHLVYWDDILSQFTVTGDLEADQFIGATNAVVASRNPQPSDDVYVVPTIWVNSTTNVPYILVSNNAPGNAIWKDLLSGDGGSGVNHNITINDGAEPQDNDPFDMWVQIDPVI